MGSRWTDEARTLEVQGGRGREIEVTEEESRIATKNVSKLLSLVRAFARMTDPCSLLTRLCRVSGGSFSFRLSSARFLEVSMD